MLRRLAGLREVVGPNPVWRCSRFLYARARPGGDLDQVLQQCIAMELGVRLRWSQRTLVSW